MSKSVYYLIAFALLIGGFVTIREYKTDPKNISKINPSFVDKSDSSQTTPEFHKWREFSSETGHFKVLIPTLPQHASDRVLDSKTGESRRYDTYIAAGEDNQAYMISLISLSKKPSEEKIDEILKSTINDMADRKPDNKLISIEPSKFHSSKAYSFILTNGDIFVRGKAFVDGNTIYILSQLSKDLSKHTTESEFFINSFDVIRVPPQAQPENKEAK